MYKSTSKMITWIISKWWATFDIFFQYNFNSTYFDWLASGRLKNTTENWNKIYMLLISMNHFCGGEMISDFSLSILHELIDSNIIIDILWGFLLLDIHIGRLICHIINLISFYLAILYTHLHYYYVCCFYIFLLLVHKIYVIGIVVYWLICWVVLSLSFSIRYACHMLLHKKTHVPDMACMYDAHKLKNKLKINWWTLAKANYMKKGLICQQW